MKGTQGKRAVRWALVLAGLLSVTATAVSGDAVVAKTLLESGKKAFAAKKYDEALPVLKKAWAEDPDLIEAIYWRAQVHERLKEEGVALAAYRDFLGKFAAKNTAGTATAEEQKLKPLAEKRIEALAVADREFQKLEEKFVADLLAIARARAASDPGAALRAANLILDVVPRHEEALALRKRLGGDTAPDPFAGVKSWREPFAKREFHHESVRYGENGKTTAENKLAGTMHAEPPVVVGNDYAGEMEFRCDEVFEDRWLVGFSLAHTKESSIKLCIERAQVRLFHLVPKSPPRTISSFATPPADPAAWHSLSFVVRGPRVQAFLDGNSVFDVVQTEKSDPSGQVGFFVGGCRAEIRKFRVGTIE